MKNAIKFLFVFLVVGAVATSCNDDDKNNKVPGAKPVITNLEVGAHHDHNESATRAEVAKEEKHVGHIGEDLHVSADIVATNKIEKVVISIHEEGEHHTHATRAETEEWEFNQEYVDLKGQLNGKFHQHIDIPSKAEAGAYHFHIKVVDQEGLTTEKEVELTLEVETEEK